MAVKLETGIRRYVGLATDRKPVVGQILEDRRLEVADVPFGSTFEELDTGDVYRWDGERWVRPATPATALASLLSECLVELRKVRFAIETEINETIEDPGA